MADVTTMELLREVAERNFVTIKLDEHEKRLEKLLHRELFFRYSFLPHIGWAKRMQTLGFPVVVDTDWALRFKYHGDVLGHCVYEQRGSRRVDFQYNGDIPEFALDNLEKFTHADLSIVSIHSMQPLPIKLVRILPIVDPVMIGWAERPRFIYRHSGWEALTYSLGVIIATWDEYKETIELWKQPK